MPFDTPDEVSNHFDTVGEEYQQKAFDRIVNYREAANAMAWRIRRLREAKTRVLDLGCGPGAFSLAVARAVESVELTLLDASENMFAMARRNLAAATNATVDARCADLREGAFPPNRFHAVISSLAFHHLQPGAKPALYRRIQHSLLPGGLFLNFEFIKEPDDDWSAYSNGEWRAFMQARGWPASHHEQEDSRNTIEEEFTILRDSGLVNAGVVLKQQCFGLIASRKPLV